MNLLLQNTDSKKAPDGTSYWVRFRQSTMLIVICSLFLALQPLKSSAGGTDTVTLIVKGPVTTQFEVTTKPFHPLSAVYPAVVSAMDPVDGNLMGNVVIDTSAINTTAVGTYPVVYSVTNLSGNTSTVYRFINVIDTAHINTGVAPDLYLIGSNYVYLPRNYSYTDSGAEATSLYFTSKQLQPRIKSTNNLDNTILGTYNYTYTLTDSFGNVATPAIRHIYVIDNKTAAVLTLNGSKVAQICLNGTYTDAGYTMYDPYYRFADISITKVGTYTGTSSPGLYYFQYKATDPDGNVSYSNYRFVNVLPSNDDACQSGASKHEVDLLVCNNACTTLTPPVTGSAYAWSTGETTQSITLCLTHDTVVAVNITNGSSVTSYAYNITVSQSYMACVWPGDANSDGVADNNDVLAIGIAYGDSVRYRDNATTNWGAQPAYKSGRTFTSGVDYVNADCNGDGYIDSLDMAAVTKNYGNTHKKTSGNGAPTDPPLSVSFSSDSAAAGDTVTATINLGTASNPVSNAYGIAFSLTYSWQDIKAGKAKANLNTSWLGTEGKNLIYFLRDDSANGKIDIAITRTDHSQISGYGVLGKVKIVMQDNLGGKTIVHDKVVLMPTDVNLISFNQTPIPLYAKPDSIIVSGALSGVSKPSNVLKDIMLYPNPASQNINIDPGNQALTGIRIVNEIGKVVFEQLDPARGRIQIPVSTLNSGIYTVIISSKNGTVAKQILKN